MSKFDFDKIVAQFEYSGPTNRIQNAANRLETFLRNKADALFSEDYDVNIKLFELRSTPGTWELYPKFRMKGGGVPTDRKADFDDWLSECVSLLNTEVGPTRGISNFRIMD